MPEDWAIDITEQLRLLSSLFLRREVGGDEELSEVNEELRVKLDRDLARKAQERRTRDDLDG